MLGCLLMQISHVGTCSLSAGAGTTSQTVLACHAGDPVTDGTMLSWKGFVSLILGAYFEKRMAWYPVVGLTH